MKVTGFTFIKNAITYDYPIIEAITSILPICDEFIVAVGKSDDDTLNLINSIDSDKIIIIETVWDDSLREGGRVLAIETDKAFKAISNDSDWAFYIQGDEVVHEKYLNNIKAAMIKYKDNKNVDGLLFNYLHFYGSYNYVGTAANWYANEIRVIKNNKNIYSYKDAQGFRKNNNEKLNVIGIDAFVYHYGWVKPPKAMQKKQESFNKLWHSDQWINENIDKVDEFNYNKNIKQLSKFKGTHPKVIIKRIATQNWEFSYDISMNKISFKDIFKSMLLKLTGVNLYSHNYNLIKE